MLMRVLDRSVCQVKETHEQHPRARRVRCCIPSPASCCGTPVTPTTCTSSSPAAYFSWTAGTTGWSLSVEEGDFVGELGMLMGQRAFLPGVAMEDTAVLRVRVEELRLARGDLGGAERCPALGVRRPAAFVEDNWGGRSRARRRRRPRPTPASGVCRAQPAPVPDGAALGRAGLVRSWRRPLRCLRRARLW